MGKVTKTGKLKKEKEGRNITIKSLVQRICTPTTADKRMKAIDSFFRTHPTDKFDHEELMHVWKGLFYAIWYSEMEKGCEEIMAVIVSISKNNPEMVKCAFETLAIEWFGIDSIRLDKFMYFVRQMTRPLIEMVACDPKSSILVTVLSSIEKCLGLIFHVCDIFVEEMFKKNQSSEVDFIMNCIKPFIDLIANNADEELSKHIVKEVLMTTLETLEDKDSPKVLTHLRISVTRLLRNSLLGSELKKVNRGLIEKTLEVFKPDVEEWRGLKRKRKVIPSQAEKNGLIYKRSKIPIAVD